MLKDGEIFLDRFMLLNLRGHTADSLGVFDLKTKALLSFDSIQQYGIGRFKTLIENKSDYLKTLKRVKDLDAEAIIFSHDYEPMGYIVAGKEKIKECMELCKKT